MAPGTDAMCSASWPSEKDLGCGFHESLSAGTRSRTRLVVCASCSTSIHKVSARLINSPFCFLVNRGCLQFCGFGPLCDFRIDVRPTVGNAFAMILGEQAKRRMPERDE